MQPLDLRPRCQGKGLQQIALADFGAQRLLRRSVPGAQQPVLAPRDTQLRTEPVTEHCRLVIATLAQTLNGQRYRQQKVGSLLAAVEAIKQALAQKFGQQSAIGPFTVVLEAYDQAVDRKIVRPGCMHLLEGRRLLEAMTDISPDIGNGKAQRWQLSSSQGSSSLQALQIGKALSIASSQSKQVWLLYNQMSTCRIQCG